ncbi:Rha family transcriptional regulator [Gracilibacillus saliphilus]|uniref:Rha family transcriptional regulator n=1 Tax=Gracilibacillus saliphilus TaxID=543890 RepID=UPI0013D3F238|nr:Rha family transcriptional regulator [Gracilibacillus saliphilus]
MNQLVFQDKNQVVTSSRNVARDFNRKHKDVLDAIDRIIEGVAENSANLFHQTFYTHEQNKQQYREYLMNRDGFTLLVMGFTGRKAMRFKMDYMNAFNEMEKQLKEPQTEIQILQRAVNSLAEVDNRVSYLEDHMRIDGIQEKKLKDKAKSIAIESLGGTKSSAYKKISRKVFSGIWRDFNNHFQLPRYSELPRKQFDDGLRFLGMWQPNTSLRIEIEELNQQQSIHEVM